jgi:predicted nicotinamide N-methyase
MAKILDTTAGEMPLEEIQLAIGDRTWSILHTDTIISLDDERGFLRGQTTTKRPYGVVLWPAALALAHDLVARDLTGTRILELGAGTGLPGIVAAAGGARVVQTDRQTLALHVCERNAARNHVSIEHRVADWTAWTDRDRYDVIIGSDILYADHLHPFLRTIFETNLAPSGSVLVADPFRTESMGFFEMLEAAGWSISMDKWTVGIAPPPRPVGVFALQPPGA